MSQNQTDPKTKTIVVALGGNAIQEPAIESSNIERQKSARLIAEKLVPLLDLNYRLVLTHGNGPQVGNILIAMDAAHNQFGIPPLPLEQCVAMTQGSLGHLLENNLSNVIASKGKNVRVISLITEVEVDKNDPAFNHPTKPIGPILDQKRYDTLKESTDWTFVTLKGNRYRRVVSSPRPKDIFIKDIVRDLLDQGFICIAGGGGGIPLYREGNQFFPIEGVVDKDFTSSLLADQLNAEILIIATAIKKVCIHFNKPNQKELDEISLKKINSYIAEGHFGEGDMLPKIQAIQQFLQGGPNREAFIVHIEDLENFRTEGTRLHS